MIKDVLVHLSVNKNDVALDYAVSVATLFDAHLAGVAIAREFPAWAAADGLAAAASLIEEWAAEQHAAASQAVDRFTERARLWNVRSDSRVISDRSGDPPGLFAEVARNYDLAVVAQSREEDEIRNDLIIEASLFDSGRPLLVVPFIQKENVKLDRLLVCWDGGRNSARAIGDAMPFLKRARKVELITVENEDRPQQLKGAAIAGHLARHGIDIELKSIVAPDADAENIILNEVADAGIDLVVMGAYGHSRFREFVLGGVTRSILDSMTAPVLMSH